MANIVDTYGRNAGKVWKTLDTCGPCTTTKIMKNTGLTKEDFYTAVGWLAKENKVWFNENTYGLGESNFDKYICKNVDKVWYLINKCDEIETNYIPKLANVTEQDAYYAVGWLAREGKITGTKAKPKKPHTKIKAK